MLLLRHATLAIISKQPYYRLQKIVFVDGSFAYVIVQYSTDFSYEKYFIPIQEKTISGELIDLSNTSFEKYFGKKIRYILTFKIKSRYILSYLQKNSTEFQEALENVLDILLQMSKNDLEHEIEKYQSDPRTMALIRAFEGK